RGPAENFGRPPANTSAGGEIEAGRPRAKLHTRRLGQRGESGGRPPPAARAGRVVVVGAGPAGVRAAHIAAARGHAVTLFGASPSTGGKLRLEAQLPGCDEYAGLIAWMERQPRPGRLKAGLGAPAGPQAVLAPEPR